MLRWLWWVSLPINEQGLGSVPGQHVPFEIANVGRRGFMGSHDLTEDRSDLFLRFRERWWQGSLGQLKQIGSFIQVEPE
jgi:hypothetical protein